MLDRRRVLQALAGLFFGGLGSAGYGWASAAAAGTTRYSLTPPGWPAGERLRIAVLSDPHIGGPHMTLARVEALVAATNALRPDLTVLLGDFVASRDRMDGDPPLADWSALFAGLRARLGRFAILGNHDWWHDPDAQRLRAGPTLVGRALEAAGIPVLENRAIRLGSGAGAFWLAGLGDQEAFLRDRRWRRRGRDDLDATLAQVTDDAPVIMLAHEPDVFARMPARVALTLSGHTHGGQVRLMGWSPVVPSRYGNRYAYGHVREEGRDLIVSAGLGTSRFPLRLGAPAEIVLVDLGDGDPA